MNDFNETSNAINSNFEERTSSMSDYSTSPASNEARYQEDTPTITPEVVDDEVVDAEVLDDIDDADLVETNPVAALAGSFGAGPVTHPLSPGETGYTREEARRVTEELKVKLLHALEAQYDFIQAAEQAFDGHIWVALGYPKGVKGWTMYCADNFAAEKIRVTGQQRTDLITGFTPGKISNRGIAALLGISRKTVDRTKANAGIAQTGRTRSADGKLRHVDTGSMSSEERRKKIVELSDAGNKQTDIADMLDVSQSTVSDTLRKDKMRRLSEGLEPAVVDNTEFDQADDDQPLELGMGDADAKIRSYIEAFGVIATQADEAIEGIVEKLEDEYWQPGGETVNEIVKNNAAKIFNIIANMGKMLRLLNIDVDNVFEGAFVEDPDDTDNDWSRFIDGCTELGQVCQDILD